MFISNLVSCFVCAKETLWRLQAFLKSLETQPSLVPHRVLVSLRDIKIAIEPGKQLVGNAIPPIKNCNWCLNLTLARNIMQHSTSV